MNLTQNVAVPTYKALVDRATELQQATAALKAAPSEAALATARAAWVAARAPWEQGEALQFGPQRDKGYEGLMDTFPISESDLAAVLASSEPYSPAYLSANNSDAQGFQTLDLLLFGANGKKTIGEFKGRELDYAAALGAYVQSNASTLLADWTTSTDGRPSYAILLTSAGASNPAFPSAAAAGQSVINGLAVIATEVHDKKLSLPFKGQNQGLVESRYSGVTLADFVENFRGIQDIYLGAPQGGTAAPGTSLAEHVAAVDAATDQTVRDQMAAAIQAIQAIPGPYAAAVANPADADAINAAITAVNDFITTVNNTLVPLVLK